jgi:transcriptional regulator with XRE-family HTH domain
VADGVRPRTGLRREELAAFLRAHRARLRPGDGGLTDGGRRRTPGLRRQEVAQLAGMSVDHYTRLEQARGPRPSRQVLSALARALMLSRDEREYLLRVAGEQPEPVTRPSREVSPGIRHLLDSMSDVPAYVVDAASSRAGRRRRTSPVKQCHLTVLDEEWEHRRFAERELTTIESSR